MPSETSSENGWSGAVAQADLVQYQPWHCGEPHLVKNYRDSDGVCFRCRRGTSTLRYVLFRGVTRKPGGKRLAFPLRAV